MLEGAVIGRDIGEPEEKGLPPSIPASRRDQEQAMQIVAAAQKAAKAAGVGSTSTELLQRGAAMLSGPGTRPAASHAQTSPSAAASLATGTAPGAALEREQPAAPKLPAPKPAGLNSAELGSPAASSSSGLKKAGSFIAGLAVAALLFVGGETLVSLKQLWDAEPRTLAKMSDSVCHIASSNDASNGAASGGAPPEMLAWTTVSCSVRVQEIAGMSELTISYPEKWFNVVSSRLSCKGEVQRLAQSGGFPCSYAAGNSEGLGVMAMSKTQLSRHKLFFVAWEFSRTGMPFLRFAAALCLLVILLIVGLARCLAKACRKRAVAAREPYDDELGLPAAYQPLCG